MPTTQAVREPPRKPPLVATAAAEGGDAHRELLAAILGPVADLAAIRSPDES